VSAAAAVSWELRFLFAVARRKQGAASARRMRPGVKICRLTSRSPSQATAGVSDYRFAETRLGTGTVSRYRRRADAVVVGAAGESAGAQLSDVAVADAVAERGRPRGVQAVRRAGSTETSVRPASASVGAATSGKEPGRRPTAQTIRGIRPPPWCVEFFHCSVFVWYCH